MPELAIGAVLVLLLAWRGREITKLGVRGLCAVAILAALASVGRYLSQVLPASIQPASFIIIMCGAAYGGGAGLFCGILVSLVSGILTGIGPWTVWQMLLWGAMGLLASRPVNSGKIPRAVYGLVWGFVFGWGMNLWFPLAGFVPVTWEYYLAACIASFPLDLAHGLTNAALLVSIGGFVLKHMKKLTAAG